VLGVPLITVPDNKRPITFEATFHDLQGANLSTNFFKSDGVSKVLWIFVKAKYLGPEGLIIFGPTFPDTTIQIKVNQNNILDA
jgi:hypothetical protein